MDAGFYVSLLAALIALASFGFSLLTYFSARKAEEIKLLLGEKETVAYTALKLVHGRLPSNEKDRQLVLMALVQACLFEKSDRARSILYRVFEINRDSYGGEIRRAVQIIMDTLNSMNAYTFTDRQLNKVDVAAGIERVAAIQTILKGPKPPGPPPYMGKYSKSR